MASEGKPLSSITVVDLNSSMNTIHKYSAEGRFSSTESVDRDGDFEVVLKGSVYKRETLDEVLRYCRICNIYPSVYLISCPLNVSQFFSEQVKKLFVVNEKFTALKFL